MKYFLFLSFFVLLATAQSCSKGDDGPCMDTKPNITVDSATWCCVYTWYQFDGSDKVEAYACGWGYSDEYKDALDSVEVDGVDGDSYCANAILMKVSFFVAALAALLAF